MDLSGIFRFAKATLAWGAMLLQVTSDQKANAFVRRRCRKGWEVEGL
jgi:hypothetical protein